MQKPLDGIKVLSFELQVAGPYCTMMLADQGADVIKVEQPGSGDTARGGAPKVANEQGVEQSGYFRSRYPAQSRRVPPGRSRPLPPGSA